MSFSDSFPLPRSEEKTDSNLWVSVSNMYGYRLWRVSIQVDTAFVWVTDLDESVEWYGRLGIEPGPRYATWQRMELGGDTQFALHQGLREPGPSTAVIAFRVDDLEKKIAELAEAGIEPVDPTITDTSAVRFVTYHDPDGNEIQVLER